MRSGVPPPKHQQSSLFRYLLPYLALYLVVFCNHYFQFTSIIELFLVVKE